jgi:TPR repeat protein
VAAFQRGDNETAARLWRNLAEQGEANSQFMLGRMYHKGAGVKQNQAEAARWFRKAAEQGDVDAQTMLGFMYALGEGVLVNGGARSCHWAAQ